MGRNGKSDRLYFLGLQNNCRMWLQSWNEKMLASWKKSYDQARQHIKNRDVTLSKRVCIVKPWLSSSHVLMGELGPKEGWALKHCGAMVLKKTLESPLNCKEIQPSILKISPEYSLEGLMLKLKLQYFGHLMQRANLLEKTLMLGKTEGRRRRAQQKMTWLDGIIDSMGMNLSKLWEIVKDR